MCKLRVHAVSLSACQRLGDLHYVICSLIESSRYVDNVWSLSTSS